MPGIFARQELNTKAANAVADLIDAALTAGWEIDNDSTIWGNTTPEEEDVKGVTEMIKFIAWKLRNSNKL